MQMTKLQFCNAMVGAGMSHTKVLRWGQYSPAQSGQVSLTEAAIPSCDRAWRCLAVRPLPHGQALLRPAVASSVLHLLSYMAYHCMSSGGARFAASRLAINRIGLSFYSKKF